MFNQARIKPMKFSIPYQDSDLRLPTFWERLTAIRRRNQINLIVLTGRGQSGKSTFGRYIASEFDSDYTMCFTVKDVLDLINKIKKDYYSGDKEKWEKWLYKWIFWDEPQLEADRQEFWTQRNMVTGFLVSSFGFLKQNMVLCLPNIRRLSDNLFTNITFRGDIFVKDNPDGSIKRMAYIKIPKWRERSQKYIWIGAETFNIPEIAEDKTYNDAKAHNFFNIQLTSWFNRLSLEGRKYIDPYKKPFTEKQIFDMVKKGTIERDMAIKQLEQSGYSYAQADLLLEHEIPSNL